MFFGGEMDAVFFVVVAQDDLALFCELELFLEGCGLHVGSQIKSLVFG